MSNGRFGTYTCSINRMARTWCIPTDMASFNAQVAHFAHLVSGSCIRLGRLDAFGRQPELGLLGRRNRSEASWLRCRRPRRPNSGWRPNATEAGVGARNPVGEITEWAI